MRKLLHSLIFLLLSVPALAQPLSDSARISLITCGKGNELYALYGHTALRIHDSLQGLDRVYNFGTFDFHTPNFALKFVKGDLQYFVSTAGFDDFLYNYNEERRTVLEQELNLPPLQCQRLYETLERVLHSPEKFYTYKFIDRNCTTRVMELLNEAMAGPVLQKTGDRQISYRDIIYPEFDGHFFEQLGVNLFFGPKTDRSAEKIFLPVELWQSVNTARYNGAPLLAKKKSWLVFETPPPPFSWWNNVYVYAIVLLLLVFWKNNVLRLSYFTVSGLLGVFFCFAGWYSFHEELQWNYNALLINPLLLGVVAAKLAKNNKAVFYWSWINFACLVIYLGCVVTKIHFLIVLPLIVTHGILLLTWAFQARKALTVRGNTVPYSGS